MMKKKDEQNRDRDRQGGNKGRKYTVKPGEEGDTFHVANIGFGDSIAAAHTPVPAGDKGRERQWERNSDGMRERRKKREWGNTTLGQIGAAANVETEESGD